MGKDRCKVGSMVGALRVTADIVSRHSRVCRAGLTEAKLDSSVWSPFGHHARWKPLIIGDTRWRANRGEGCQWA
jgi:hypothetical protein